MNLWQESTRLLISLIWSLGILMTNRLEGKCTHWYGIIHYQQENHGSYFPNLQVNRKGDEVAQMATDYNAVEIAFFKAIVRLLSIRTCLFQLQVVLTRSSK